MWKVYFVSFAAKHHVFARQKCSNTTINNNGEGTRWQTFDPTASRFVQIEKEYKNEAGWCLAF